MVKDEPHYSKDEFAKRGDERYEKKIRAQIEHGNEGKVVAIDIDSGEFEVADDALTASVRGILWSRCDRWQRQQKL